jgi:hypothetical protein
MLCDVISAVTEFMVRVFHLRHAIGIHDGARMDALQCGGPNNMPKIVTLNHA